jgi:biopolymer transport protein ExbB
MRRYASSKFRVMLFLVLIGAALFAMAAPGFAQDAAAAAGGETTTVKKENLFSLILHNIDFVFITIALLSIIGITLIIQGFIKNRASVMIPETSTNAIREMIAQKKFKELIEFTETDPSFVSRALNPALKRAPSFSSMKEAMETAIGEQTAEQFRKIEYLNIIGNLGPLLGLLGTVLGMIVAFNEMNAAGAQGANPAQLAGGISKALAHTFLGLILAVPCLAAFGVLRTIVDRLTVRGALIAEELLLMVKPAEAKMPQPGAPAPVGAPAAIPGRPPVGPAPIPAPVAQPQPIPGLPRKPATPSPVGPS